jgi:hypothetical protein
MSKILLFISLACITAAMVGTIISAFMYSFGAGLFVLSIVGIITFIIAQIAAL